jgi:hypothetical protein
MLALTLCNESAGQRAVALQQRRVAAAALTALVLLKPQSVLAIAGVLLSVSLEGAHAIEEDVALWQAACDAACATC